MSPKRKVKKKCGHKKRGGGFFKRKMRTGGRRTSPDMWTWQMEYENRKKSSLKTVSDLTLLKPLKPRTTKKRIRKSLGLTRRERSLLRLKRELKKKQPCSMRPAIENMN